MSSYKFRIGQMVDFVPAQRYSAASCSYKILRLLPSEGGERLYRIKTITEACDRVVRESELRAPLNAMIGLSGKAREAGTGAVLREYLQSSKNLR